MEERLNDAVKKVEDAATELSNILVHFDLSGIPEVDTDLNKCSIGTKVKAAKWLAQIIRVARIQDEIHNAK